MTNSENRMTKEVRMQKPRSSRRKKALISPNGQKPPSLERLPLHALSLPRASALQCGCPQPLFPEPRQAFAANLWSGRRSAGRGGIFRDCHHRPNIGARFLAPASVPSVKNLSDLGTRPVAGKKGLP